jgi:nucleoside-diphosphate-sugar epimerase
LLSILDNSNDACKNQIINIGNPDNECSVKELADILKRLFMDHPDHRADGAYSEIIEVPAQTYYGKGYQDIYTRKPSIEKARTLLDWSPKINLEDSLRMTLYSFLEENEPFTRGK